MVVLEFASVVSTDYSVHAVVDIIDLLILFVK